MAQPIASKSDNSPRGSLLLKALLPFLIMAVAVYASFRHMTPPDALSADASPQNFSSGRAMQHLRSIAQRPHPVGSIDHARVRDYIVAEVSALGYIPEMQKVAASNYSGPQLVGATVENIYVRVKGGGDGKAVLFVAHYDSTPTGPGASDDGAGVATLLETMRALKEGPPRENDLAFLFTDGEEIGLLGAKAFVEQHPAARDVKVALNFEARGNAGPSIMFETSRDNGWLVGELAQGAPHPIASSLTYEIYRRLPNDTDLSVFKNAGIAGLNFAYISGLNYYHTELDSVAHIDERSLQHHGSYALSLAHRLGNLNLDQVKRRDAVYFDVPGELLIRYSGAWLIPLAALMAALFTAVVWYGLKRKRLSLSGIGLGSGAFLLSVTGTALAIFLLDWITRRVDSSSGTIGQAEPYNSLLYFTSFVATAIAVTTGLYIWFAKKVSAQNLTAGGLIWWLVLMAATSLLAPGASYLFTWPLAFGIIALLAMVREDSRSSTQRAIISVLAVPGLVMLTPIIYMFHLAMSLRATLMIAVFVALLLSLLIPQFALTSARARWALPVAALTVSAGFYIAAILTSGFDQNRPRPSSVFYAMNADSKKAVWASFDRTPGEWNSQFFNGNVERGPLNDYMATGYGGYMKSEAPQLSLEAPSVETIADSTEKDVRILRLLIRSARQAPILMISADPEVEVLSSTIRGERVPNQEGRRWALHYYAAPADGLEITLEVKPSKAVKLRVADQSYGLPETPNLALRPRADNIMLSPLPFNDTTVVSKSVAF